MRFNVFVSSRLALPSPEPERVGPGPVRVGLFRDAGLVGEGVRAVLRRRPARFTWVDCEAGQGQVDVLLVDPWVCGVVPVELLRVVRDTLGPGRVVCFSWRSVEQAQALTVGCGFDDYLSKHDPPQLLADRLTRAAGRDPRQGPGPVCAQVDAVSPSTVGHAPASRAEPTLDTGTTRATPSPPRETVSRETVSRAEGSEWEMLSPREIQVMRLVMEGAGNGEVAERLGLSHNTVKSYIRNLYRKIGVRTRSQAVRWGFEHPDHP